MFSEILTSSIFLFHEVSFTTWCYYVFSIRFIDLCVYLSLLILPNFNYSSCVLLRPARLLNQFYFYFSKKFIYTIFFTYTQNLHNIFHLYNNSDMNSGDIALNFCINLRRFDCLTMLNLPTDKRCFAIY